MTDRSQLRNDYDSKADTSEFTHAAVLYIIFSVVIVFVACCVCRLPDALYRWNVRRALYTREGSPDTQDDIEFKEVTAAAIFVNPSGNSCTVGTLADDNGDVRLQMEHKRSDDAA